MANSTKIKGFRKHMNQIFASWEGIDMTLRKKVFTLDPNGKSTGEITNTDITIKGVISSVSFSKYEKAAGRTEDRQLTGVFLWDADNDASLMPVEEDRIIDSTDGINATYVVQKIMHVDWDIAAPVMISAELKMVPYEA